MFGFRNSTCGISIRHILVKSYHNIMTHINFWLLVYRGAYGEWDSARLVRNGDIPNIVLPRRMASKPKFIRYITHSQCCMQRPHATKVSDYSRGLNELYILWWCVLAGLKIGGICSRKANDLKCWTLGSRGRSTCVNNALHAYSPIKCELYICKCEYLHCHVSMSHNRHIYTTIFPRESECVKCNLVVCG